MKTKGKVLGVLHMINGIKFLECEKLSKCDEKVVGEFEKLRSLVEAVEKNQPTRSHSMVADADLMEIRLLHFATFLQLLKPRLLLLCAHSFDLLKSSEETSQLYK